MARSAGFAGGFCSRLMQVREADPLEHVVVRIVRMVGGSVVPGLYSRSRCVFLLTREIENKPRLVVVSPLLVFKPRSISSSRVL